MAKKDGSPKGAAPKKWTPEDYIPGVTLSGAHKLADSQVAPLVAQARGYQTVIDEDGAKTIAKMTYTASERSLTSQLKLMVRGGNDFLYIPWFSFGAVLRDGAAVVSGTTQVRPSTPIAGKDGKPRKYLNASGHSSVIDTHPATPAEWISKSPRVLITEGVIKGDAALTAQLLAAGIKRSELAATANADPVAARRILQELMLRVPASDRVPILSMIGVANWHQNPEWNSLSLRDRDVLVAFDGDLRQNRMVWDQAERMWRFIDESKKGNPKLLDLGGPDAEKDRIIAGADPEMKIGIDDYLSHIGSWPDLLRLVDDNLPPAPEKTDADAVPGEFRVTPDGTAVQEYVKHEDNSVFGGGGPSYSWMERVSIGGRVKSIASLRMLTDVSVRDGYVRPGAVVNSPRGHCVIELTWKDPVSGQEVTREVTGPHAILGHSPAEWGRQGAVIHTDILRHPAWPPRDKVGNGFLSAIKAHRAEEQELLDGWDTMGWVPTQSGTPVYVIGEQSLGASREDERDNRPGVTEESMPMASNYGVRDTYWGFFDDNDIDGWKAQIREDVRTAMTCFIVDPAWNQPAVGATALGCALRPTIPGRTKTSLFLSGAPHAGKSFLASFIMSFMGREGGIWTEHNLPGQASDTAVAMEHSRARTPLYVIDDLAPNSSRLAAEKMESVIEGAIRSGHNGAGKRRGTADGEQRAVSHPRALVIFTAENRMDGLSILQRTISVHLNADSKRTDRDRALEVASIARSEQNPFARLTAAMIRFWLNIDIEDTVLPMLRRDVHYDALHTWKDKHDFAESSIKAAQLLIQTQLQERYGITSSSSARRAGMFAELFFTLDVLQALALWAGVDPQDPAMKPFFAKNDEIGTLRGAMIDLAAQDLREFRSRSNSRNLIEAIRNLLEAGRAHLEHPTMSGARPVQSGENSDYWNKAAGWRFDPRSDQWVPCGIPIGYLGVPSDSEDDDSMVALLSTANAFNLAQREHPTLVPPGQKAGDTWGQVWEDEDGALVHPRYQRPSNGREYSVKARLIGNVVTDEDGDASTPLPARVERLRGVPVLFSAMVPSPDGD